MSFLSPEKDSTSKIPRIYSRWYEWKGGLSEPIDPANPASGTKPIAKIKWTEKVNDEKITNYEEPKMSLAVVGITYSLTAYIKSAKTGAAVSYRTNEVPANEWGQTFRVVKNTSQESEVVVVGGYAEAKEAVPQLKSQYNVYFYNFERKCLDKFSFVGSSYGAWKEFYQANKAKLYAARTNVELGEYKKFDVGAAYLPKFSLDQTLYTQAEIDEITQLAVKMEELLAQLSEQSQNFSRGDIEELPNSVPRVIEAVEAQEIPATVESPDDADADDMVLPF